MQAANDVKFRDRFGIAGSRSLEGFFERHGVGASCIVLASESAETAGGNADVGGIDVPVDVEICHVAMQALTHVIGKPPDSQNVRGAIERDRVFKAEPLAGQYLG